MQGLLPLHSWGVVTLLFCTLMAVVSLSDGHPMSKTIDNSALLRPLSLRGGYAFVEAQVMSRLPLAYRVSRLCFLHFSKPMKRPHSAFLKHTPTDVVHFFANSYK